MAESNLNAVEEELKTLETVNAVRNEKSDNYSFKLFDICCVLFSLGAFMADFITDIFLIWDYSQRGYIFWAISTLLLVLVPTIIVQLFSLRWHKLDEELSKWHWITHACLLGVAHRYVTVLQVGFEAIRTGHSNDYQRLYQHQSDLCMLHLFDSFLESAPQLVLQLYIMSSLDDWHPWTGISALASLSSLAWAVAAYTRAMRRARPDKKHVRWPGLILQAAWRGGMLCARITALVLFAFMFHSWLCLIIFIHWLCMTTWVVHQKTDFCPTAWEEFIYNCVIGVIYCFDFFNLQEGPSRCKVTTFYIIIVTQNIACLIIVIISNRITRWEVFIVASVFILAGSMVGICSMILYYTIFHPAGPISFCPINANIESASIPDMKTITDTGNHTNILRTLKRPWHMDREENNPCSNNIENSPQSEDSCTDKKLLLENWIARSGSPMFASVPITVPNMDTSVNDDVEFYTVANTPLNTSKHEEGGIVNNSFKSENECSFENKNSNNDDINKQKRRGICSPTELGLRLNELSSEEKISIEEAQTSYDTHQKRRGIYSLFELEIELDEFSPKKNLENSIKIKHPDIFSKVNVELNNSHKNTIELSKKVSTAEDMKPSDAESSSEILSTHDYENICAVNIAREPWGLRSWQGYCDIETHFHDDSTIRDRRRDTLTSTATSGSSEISSRDSPLVFPIRKLHSRQDDYLDTLIYDLANCNIKQSDYLDINDAESESNVYIAKPYVIDQHGTLFPLTKSLEPIREETEESSSLTSDSSARLNKLGGSSESALVATIDEIRRGSTTNSPRHVYHYTENVWDSNLKRNADILANIDQVPTVKSLWCTKNNCVTKISSVRKSVLPFVSLEKPLLIDQITKNDNVNSCMTPKKKNDSPLSNLVIESPRSDIALNLKSSLFSDDEEMFSSTTEHELPTKDVNTDNISDENLISTINKDYESDSSSYITNKNNKKTGNRPRRKFSLIREKFEPKYKLSVSEGNINKTPVQSCDDITEVKLKKLIDKENLTPVLPTPEVLEVNSSSEILNLSEKRSLFLNQVLSSPKLNSCVVKKINKINRTECNMNK